METILHAYEARGIALIRKTDPPVRVMGSPMKRRVIFMENPWLDYAGTWTAENGRMIVVEAKSTTEPLLRIIGEGKDGSGIKHRQLVAAERFRDAGAAVCFLWEHRGEIRIFTPAMVRAALLERKSLQWMNAHRIPQGNGFILFDFLACLKALTRRTAADTLNHATTSDTLRELPPQRATVCAPPGSEAEARGNDHTAPPAARHAANDSALAASVPAQAG